MSAPFQVVFIRIAEVREWVVLVCDLAAAFRASHVSPQTNPRKHVWRGEFSSHSLCAEADRTADDIADTLLSDDLHCCISYRGKGVRQSRSLFLSREEHPYHVLLCNDQNADRIHLHTHIFRLRVQNEYERSVKTNVVGICPCAS